MGGMGGETYEEEHDFLAKLAGFPLTPDLTTIPFSGGVSAFQ